MEKLCPKIELFWVDTEFMRNLMFEKILKFTKY